MNNDIRRHFGKKSAFILSAGLLGLLLGPLAGAISLSEAASPQAPSLNNSKIIHSLPGAKTGLLKKITDTTAQIDNASYPLILVRISRSVFTSVCLVMEKPEAAR